MKICCIVGESGQIKIGQEPESEESAEVAQGPSGMTDLSKPPTQTPSDDSYMQPVSSVEQAVEAFRSMLSAAVPQDANASTSGETEQTMADQAFQFARGK